MTVQLPPPMIISTLPDLQNLAQLLQSESLIAVDTESNSLYAYREQVCLIQISTRTRDWVVDPLAITDVSVLGPIFADPRIEKVFHAAEYDLICMKRDFNFSFANLFDTMISARTIGRKLIGLGNMLEDFFGVQVDKHFQRADWSIRPIPEDQLRYAQQDTHYLPALRDQLTQIMHENDCLIEAREMFEALLNVPAGTHGFDTEGYWRIQAVRDLTLRQIAILRELYLLRDQEASRRNRPPFKIMNDEALIGIVKVEPQQLTDLYHLPGLGQMQIERYGNAILQAVRRGRTAKLPARPEQTHRMDPETLARYDVLHKWRKERAIERGVESDVILPKEAMWAIARRPPQSLEELAMVPSLGPWKRQKYGEALLKVLTDFDQIDPARNGLSDAKGGIEVVEQSADQSSAPPPERSSAESSIVSSEGE